MKSHGCFSLSLDIWTSGVSRTDYLGVILSYIDQNFQLNYRLIGLEVLQDPHTGAYICDQLMLVLEQFLSLKIGSIFSITRDNASNNDKCLLCFSHRYFNSAMLDFQNDIRCNAHILNLVAKAILDKLGVPARDILKRVKNIVIAMRGKKEIKQLFERSVRSQGSGNAVTIPLDSVTRWNSTLYMVRGTLRAREHLEFVKRSTKDASFQDDMLSATEWEVLVGIKDILEIFEIPSTNLQGQEYTTINEALLYMTHVYQSLQLQIHKCRTNEESLSDSLIPSIENGINKLCKYFPPVTNFEDLTKFKAYHLSIVLDPRAKLNHYLNGELLCFYPGIEVDIKYLLEREYKSLENELKEVSSDISEGEIEPEPKVNDLNLYNFKRKKNSEVDSYIIDPTIDRFASALDYWKVKQDVYPILSILARRYFAIPATSASVESTFSIARNIISYQRNRLLLLNAKKLMLLKSWGVNGEELEES